MLVRFSVENYRCFRDRVELSMVAAPFEEHRNHVISGKSPKDISLLKLAVIYGANASGKSNLVRALETARRIILRPAESGKSMPIVPYKLDVECLHKPTRFEFEIKGRSGYFAYGFVASAKQVEEEWLYKMDGEQESCIFERDRRGFRFPGLKPKIPEQDQFLNFTAKGTLENRLFLAECRQRDLQKNVPEAEVLFDVLRWFEDDVHIIFPDSKFRRLFQEVKSNQAFKEELTKFLRCFDTGVEEIDLEEVSADQLGLPDEVWQKMEEDLKEG